MYVQVPSTRYGSMHLHAKLVLIYSGITVYESCKSGVLITKELSTLPESDTLTGGRLVCVYGASRDGPGMSE